MKGENKTFWVEINRSLYTLSDSWVATRIWPKICSSDLKNLWAVYLDRKMFFLSVLLVSKFFNQLANLIVLYHLVKIVNGYIQQGCYLTNASSPTNGWKCEDQKLVVQWSSLPTTPSTLSNLVKCNCKKNSSDSMCLANPVWSFTFANV